MRDKGKKFGFKWQGEEDSVHFDYINNEPNDKWLRPSKNKWIPNIDPVTTKTKSSGTKIGSKPDANFGDRMNVSLI